jgi:hypothetical protein
MILKIKLKKKIYTWEPGAVGHGEPFPAPAPKPWFLPPILELDVVEQPPSCPNSKKIFFTCNIY